MGRVLVFHLCDPGSNPTLGSYFFFFHFFFFFFFCLSRIHDNRAVRVKALPLASELGKLSAIYFILLRSSL